MLAAVVHDPVVDLVGDRDRVEFPAEPRDALELGASEDATGRVVRRVQDDRTRALREGAPQAVGIELPARRLQRDVDLASGREAHGRQVVLVERLDDDHLVARVDHGEDRGADRLGHAAGDDDVAVGVEAQPVEFLHRPRDRRSQRRDAPGDRVLVVAAVEGRVGGGNDLRRRREVRKTLRQVHRLVAEREAGHLADDGGAQPVEACGGTHAAGAKRCRSIVVHARCLPPRRRACTRSAGDRPVTRRSAGAPRPRPW